MLAGYLPFDDDPANPEGDNINLLYKYIVSTPLTFPEYVTPHARDLLRRILVPDPRKRADLFEVARHSWLNEYADVVGFITSSTTTTVDIANATVTTEDHAEVPLLARSASVREPSKTQKIMATAVGDLGRKHGTIDQDAEDSYPKPQKDNKRRTVQVEYVAPRSQTVRGEDAPVAAPSGSRTRARAGSQGPVEVTTQTNKRAISTEKPLPQDPPTSTQYHSPSQNRKIQSSQAQQGMAPPTRPGRDPPRSVSDNPYSTPGAAVSIARPNTGGSMTSTASGMGSMGLPTRGSYSQPVAPTVAGTNAHGHMSQPKNGKKYVISSPMLQDGPDMDYGRPSISQVPPKFARVAGFPDGSGTVEPKGHKRSNTVSGISEKIFGRNVSFFGGKSQQSQDKPQEKPKKSYPPVSMNTVGGVSSSRQSIDSSRRSISFGFGRKRSGSIAGSGDASSQEKPKRFSLLPASFSLKAIGIGKDYGTPGAPPDDQYYDEPEDNNVAYLEPQSRSGQSRSGTAGTLENAPAGTALYERSHDSPVQQDRRAPSGTPPQHQRYASQAQSYDGQISGEKTQYVSRATRPQQPTMPNDSNASMNYHNQIQHAQNTTRYPQGFNGFDPADPRQAGNRGGRGLLQKNNRKFVDGYEQEPNQGYGGGLQNSGSSGAARKVMDFFRRRGKARESDDR
jgi:protein-serine/threonine kinase